jgi:hypothetical protein
LGRQGFVKSRNRLQFILLFFEKYWIKYYTANDQRLENNPFATTTQFLDYLQDLYSKQTNADSIPNVTIIIPPARELTPSEKNYYDRE